MEIRQRLESWFEQDMIIGDSAVAIMQAGRDKEENSWVESCGPGYGHAFGSCEKQIAGSFQSYLFIVHPALCCLSAPAAVERLEQSS